MGLIALLTAHPHYTKQFLALLATLRVGEEVLGILWFELIIIN